MGPTPTQDVPIDDRHLYSIAFKTAPSWEEVFYPPVSDDVLQKANAEVRAYYIDTIESKLGVSLPGYVEDEPLYIWEVAEFLDRTSPGWDKR